MIYVYNIIPFLYRCIIACIRRLFLRFFSYIYMLSSFLRMLYLVCFQFISPFSSKRLIQGMVEFRRIETSSGK